MSPMRAPEPRLAPTPAGRRFDYQRLRAAGLQPGPRRAAEGSLRGDKHQPSWGSRGVARLQHRAIWPR